MGIKWRGRRREGLHTQESMPLADLGLQAGRLVLMS